MLRNLVKFMRTGKTAKQRREEGLEKIFKSMFEDQRPEPKVLKVIPVPESLIVELYAKGKDTTPSGERDFWKFIYANFPVQESDRIRICSKKITQPVLEVLEDTVETVKPVAVATVKPEDEDEMFRLLTLSNADNAGPLEKYNLWKALEAKLPEITGFKHRALRVRNSCYMDVIDKGDAGSDDEDE